MSDSTATTPKVYIVHENPEWIPPLVKAFEEEHVPFQEWDIATGSIDLFQEPPQGVFWSRLSASSPSRDHPHAKEYARALYAWLESYGRTVVNSLNVLELEVSKVAQYTALKRAGFDVPHTVAVFGRNDLLDRAREFTTPFITKHNQGGKGLGVRKFESFEEFERFVVSDEWRDPIDGVTLLQEYIVTAQPFITRLEFIGGKLHYAVRVDTSGGKFTLCPADACAIDDDGHDHAHAGGQTTQGFAPAACEAPASPLPQALPHLPTAAATLTLQRQALAPAACEPDAVSGVSAFTPRADITRGTPLVRQLEAFLADQRIDIAGIEFFETADGRTVVYDINTNTNYNSAVEAVAPSAAHAVARYLGGLLAQESAV
ncbi:ATP-grasp domain-containing protein [Bifidobacterium cebidarum]|uniref:Alpha-L-glutamate ligase n=1 Tax=Bifidobacterium cebidarum TaxID=2650773 RepID=A0A6I1GI70_9BIFI|nr:alpha-L-glutamate ligase [Bifidobacterium cebidarum]KAB7789109.1 alpha-L-glutamate ligase [Bifidobacterium cebidarum]